MSRTIILLAIAALMVQSCKKKQTKDYLQGYTLEWGDEFDGTALDTTKWAYRVDNKHRSIQRKENVSLSKGKLMFTLRQLEEPLDGQLASGAGIVSKKRFKYGYYEVRAKLGTGEDTDNDGFVDDGWHHSFWAMAAVVDASEVSTTYPAVRRTEIDGFENATDHTNKAESSPHVFTQHVIVWDENGKEWGRLPKPPNDITKIKAFNTNEWHTYGFKWTPENIEYYVDGKRTKVSDYPVERFVHDEINVWITAISAQWCKAGAQDSRAEYDYFRFYSKK